MLRSVGRSRFGKTVENLSVFSGDLTDNSEHVAVGDRGVSECVCSDLLEVTPRADAAAFSRASTRSRRRNAHGDYLGARRPTARRHLRSIRGGRRVAAQGFRQPVGQVVSRRAISKSWPDCPSSAVQARQVAESEATSHDIQPPISVFVQRFVRQTVRRDASPG